MTSRALLVFLLGLSLMLSGWNTASAAAAKNTRTSKAVVKATIKPATKKTAKPARATTKKTAKPAKAAARKTAIRHTPKEKDPGSDDTLVLDIHGNPLLHSAAFYIANQATGRVLLERNSATVLPIASITKLMTAMVVLEAGQSLREELTISDADIDALKGTSSRLVIGTRLSREEMLHLALMSSENRAASALARHYPGGLPAFVEAMNVKARLLELSDTRFHDSTGLNPDNVSSPRDLARMVSAAANYPLIREFSTTPEREVDIGGRTLHFKNTNALVGNPDWEISVSKTGYISEAGRCLVMQAWMHHQPMVIVLMDSNGRYTRTADAQRVRKWLETAVAQRLAAAAKPHAG